MASVRSVPSASLSPEAEAAAATVGVIVRVVLTKEAIPARRP